MQAQKAASSRDLARELQSQTVLLLARMTKPLSVVLAFALWAGFRRGFGVADYLVLAVGSVSTLVAAFAYSLLAILRALGRPKRRWMVLAALGGWIPFLFFCYLVFYCGFWHLASLRLGFAWLPLVKTAVFVPLGYIPLRHFAHITELGRMTNRLLDNVGSISERHSCA